ANLHRWFASPERRQLIEEAAAFTEEYHTRIARTGFDQWFPVKNGVTAPPAPWKANMLVLALLYPIVFLFGNLVQTPWLEGWAGMPFYVALFLANIIGILILSFLVPWASNRLAWWLSPPVPSTRSDLQGAALMVAMYVLCLLVFSRFLGRSRGERKRTDDADPAGEERRDAGDDGCDASRAHRRRPVRSRRDHRAGGAHGGAAGDGRSSPGPRRPDRPARLREHAPP